MHSRRHLLKTLGAGALGAATLTATGIASRRAKADTLKAFASGSRTGAPWCLLSPLQPGSTVGKGWKVHSLGPVRNGAAILSLTHKTHGAARVHVCMRQGKATGLAHSHLLDLVLMDGGDGAKPTQEALGRVVHGIAKRIAKNELGAVEDGTLDAMTRMLTHQERLALYGPENIL
jgi:hypothetical protein